QGYDNTTVLGTATAVTYNGNAPTSDTIVTQTITTGVTPAIVDSANFNVQVTFDNNGASDLTAHVNYVQVSVAYSDGSTTASVQYGGFGFGSVIPSDATINSITVVANWMASRSTASATFSFQAYKGAKQVPISGVSLSQTQPAAITVASSVTVANPGLTGAD